ncbi:hypothetical protein Gorai_016858, partial [Gossypium raimondii]|nr:hypothetical protein [Gossypium raimondii]
MLRLAAVRVRGRVTKKSSCAKNECLEIEKGNDIEMLDEDFIMENVDGVPSISFFERTPTPPKKRLEIKLGNKEISNVGSRFNSLANYQEEIGVEKERGNMGIPILSLQ